MTRPSDAELYAAAFVGKYGVDCRLRLPEIANCLSLAVRHVDADGFDGALIRVRGANRGRILLNRNVREPGRRLFTFLHEIAHYVIPGHGRDAEYCRAADVETWDEHVRATEREANTFAAAVLMPESVCRPFVRQQPAFRIVEAMKEACGSSLTATLVRYVQLSSFPVAMAYAEAGKVTWYWRGTEFPLAVRKGPLDPESFAVDAHAGDSVPDDLESVPATAWLYEDSVRSGARLFEASRALPRYDAVVSLLYAPDPVRRSDPTEDEDDSLDPTEFTLDRQHWPSKR